MPVILHPDDCTRWLDPRASPDDIHSLLRLYDGPMTAAALGQYVNSPAYEGPRCIEPG